MESTLDTPQVRYLLDLDGRLKEEDEEEQGATDVATFSLALRMDQYV